jgi:hypothetical protein
LGKGEVEVEWVGHADTHGTAERGRQAGLEFRNANTIEPQRNRGHGEMRRGECKYDLTTEITEITEMKLDSI